MGKAINYSGHAKIKKLIEEKLNSLELDEARMLIKAYENICPKDMELMSFYVVYYLAKLDANNALEYAKKAEQQFPTSPEVNYNLGCVYEALGELDLAIVYQKKACNLYFAVGAPKEELDVKKDHLEELCDLIKSGEINNYKFGTGIEKINDFMVSIQFDRCGLYDYTFSSLEAKIGTVFFPNHYTEMYIADYRLQYADKLPKSMLSPCASSVEIRKVEKGNKFELNSEGKYLLPIAVADSTEHIFKQKGSEYIVPQSKPHHFNYYLVEGNTEVISSTKAFYSEPIKLEHSKKRKKVVLGIFVDGLTQTVLNDLEEAMPYTYNFFSKGDIYTQAYSSAEWTYPSFAAVNTGLYTPNHMLFHNTLQSKLPDAITTLAEYFKNEGYFTAKIDGDWRSTPEYGYWRGYDQIIYHNQRVGAKNETTIGTVIEHLDAFKDTDQFLCFCLGDLHDVADGFDLALSAQTRIPISMRVEDAIGITSVKQDYSEYKKYAYMKMIRSIDVLLGTLYAYLESNYTDEEYIVSIFSDHGQGYLVKNDDFFLSPERTNVAFMFRGGDAKHGIISEVVSICDYIPIMCSLTNIKLNTEIIDGRLPKILGGEGHEIVICDSIHPGDPYRAAVITNDYIAYFENLLPVDHDGRFYLRDYSLKVFSKKNFVMIQDENTNYMFEKIVLTHIAALIIYE